MNTFMKQLAEKAGLSYILVPGNPFIEEDLQKFADLIKAECAAACNDFACGRTHSAEDLIDMHFEHAKVS